MTPEMQANFAKNHTLALKDRATAISDKVEPADGNGHSPEFTPVVDLEGYKQVLKSIGIGDAEIQEKIELCKSMLASSSIEHRKAVALGVTAAVRSFRENGKRKLGTSPAK